MEKPLWDCDPAYPVQLNGFGHGSSGHFGIVINRVKLGFDRMSGFYLRGADISPAWQVRCTAVHAGTHYSARVMFCDTWNNAIVAVAMRSWSGLV